MKLYLSSYKLGDKKQRLRSLTPNQRILYVPNACDYKSADPTQRKKHVREDMASLETQGIKTEILDLTDYFGEKEKLREKVRSVGAVFVSGGNVFVLRQAMRLSGFDDVLKEIVETEKEFLYAGYSAGPCALSPDLSTYDIVDKPRVAYEGLEDVIWEGLSIIPYAVMPHYDSDHEESRYVQKEIERCIETKTPFVALRDGDVLILDV